MAEKKKGADKSSKKSLDSVEKKEIKESKKSGLKMPGLPKTKKGMIITGVVLIALVVIGTFTLGIYKFGWKDDVTVAYARVIPSDYWYPALFVNGKPVQYGKYQDYRKAYTTYVTEFYIKGEKKIDVNSAEAKKIIADSDTRVKELLVKNTVVLAEVKKRNIKYTKKEFEDAFNEFVKRTGGEKEVENNLKKYYGLTVQRFKSEFFVDTFLAGKLQNAFQNDKSLNADAEKKANEVLAKVKKGEDFAELAKKYSEDTSAAKGGDLGFVKKGMLVPEFEDALWKLQPGQTSELVKTVYGYHIIKLTEVKGEERKASHILVKTKDFDTWLEEETKKAKVNYWVK